MIRLVLRLSAQRDLTMSRNQGGRPQLLQKMLAMQAGSGMQFDQVGGDINSESGERRRQQLGAGVEVKRQPALPPSPPSCTVWDSAASKGSLNRPTFPSPSRDID